MCSINTDAMNRRDITSTGTGPLEKINKYIFFIGKYMMILSDIYKIVKLNKNI